jgi:hypothetical protein
MRRLSLHVHSTFSAHGPAVLHRPKHCVVCHTEVGVVILLGHILSPWDCETPVLKGVREDSRELAEEIYAGEVLEKFLERNQWWNGRMNYRRVINLGLGMFGNENLSQSSFSTPILALWPFKMRIQYSRATI